MENKRVRCIKETEGFIVGKDYELKYYPKNESELHSVIVNEKGFQVPFTKEGLDEFFEPTKIQMLDEVNAVDILEKDLNVMCISSSLTKFSKGAFYKAIKMKRKFSDTIIYHVYYDASKGKGIQFSEDIFFDLFNIQRKISNSDLMDEMIQMKNEPEAYDKKDYCDMLDILGDRLSKMIIDVQKISQMLGDYDEVEDFEDDAIKLCNDIVSGSNYYIDTKDEG
jgi:hypothetical protein